MWVLLLKGLFVGWGNGNRRRPTTTTLLLLVLLLLLLPRLLRSGSSFREDEIRSLGGREGGSNMQTMDIHKTHIRVDVTPS
jgi:hypothetical protein